VQSDLLTLVKVSTKKLDWKLRLADAPIYFQWMWEMVKKRSFKQSRC